MKEDCTNYTDNSGSTPESTQCPEEGSCLQHLEVCAVNTAAGVTSLSVLCRGFKTFQSKHHLNRDRATTKNSEERKALTTWFSRQAGVRVWAAGGFLLACICQHHQGRRPVWTPQGSCSTVNLLSSIKISTWWGNGLALGPSICSRIWDKKIKANNTAIWQGDAMSSFFLNFKNSYLQCLS